MKFIVVNAVNGNTGPSRSVYDETTGRETVIPSQETTALTVIPLDGNLRSFNKRKGQRVGTRLVFMNGTALPVTNTVAEVVAMIAAVDPDAATSFEACRAAFEALAVQEQQEAAAAATVAASADHGHAHTTGHDDAEHDEDADADNDY